LPDAVMRILLEVLRERVRPKGPNQEKLAQFALAGLLRFLAPRFGDELRTILAPLAGMLNWLYHEALQQTFVPALFALEGITLLRHNQLVFTRPVCAGLLAASMEYEDVGTAIEHLRNRVQEYAKF
jgi:hypothetical protein